MDTIIEYHGGDGFVKDHDYGDSIRAWANAHGMTLDMALSAGVWSGDNDDQWVYVPVEVAKGLANEDR